MKTAVLSLVLLALGPILSGQQTPYIETFEVRLHNLDVVVTDAKGNPVRGLTKEDFVVLDGGTPQPITNFSVYDTRAAHDVAEASASAQAEPVATPPPPRRFVFFIDELMVQKMARTRLVENANAFVDKMGEGDLAAVVQPTAQEKIAQQFTSDKAAIRAALQKAIEESSEAAGPRQEISALRYLLRGTETPVMRRAARYEYADRAKRRVEHRLGQLRALTSSLAGVEGKKVVILISQGLSTRPGEEAWDPQEAAGSLRAPSPDNPEMASDDPARIERPVIADFSNAIEEIIRSRAATDLLDRVREIGRSAAANGVTIYSIEPDTRADLMPLDNTATPIKNGRPDPDKDIPKSFELAFLQNAGATMDSLAKSTGGRSFRGVGGIDDVFRQVRNDVSFYYSLAYRATGDADRPRNVTVSVRNRPKLRVRTRSEVLEKSTSREMNDLVVASLLYPRTINELGIQVTPGAPKESRGLFTVPLDVVVPLKNLTFLSGEDGRYVATFDLYFAAAGERHDFGSGGEQQQKIEISKEQHARIEEMTYRYKTGVQVSPGRARIAIGILDPVTKLTGFQTVEVLAQ